MKLQRRKSKMPNRYRPSDRLGRSFDLPALFDDFVTRDFFYPTFTNSGVSTPAVNIIETNDDFRLEMVAPGMKKKNFNVEVDGDVLTVSYDHEDNRQGERSGWNYASHEYNYHSFTRSFSLPETADIDAIKSKYEDGILNVIIPKKDDAKGKPPRRIEVS